MGSTGGGKMEKRQTNVIVTILTLCAVLLISSFAPSESWGAEKKFPNRIINFVLPYNPGAADLYYRPYVEKLPAYLGQPISIIYKPGAAGTIGGSFVANSRPDGYNLMITSPGSLILGPVTKEGIDYTYDSFAPICNLFMVPMFLAVKADSPLKNLADVIAAAKASPGKLTYSHSGVFGSPHFATEIFLKSAKIKLAAVPCNGDTPATTALLGGHVDMYTGGVGPLKPHVDAGALRLIALFDEKRMKSYPDIPTFLESGHRAVFPLAYGLVAPKGTPVEIINTLNDAIKKVNTLDRNFIEEKCKQLGIEQFYLNADDFDKLHRTQLTNVKAVFKDLTGK
jgi:tripartite-type tricarboxylate transporter receptor subunit TctC